MKCKIDARIATSDLEQKKSREKSSSIVIGVVIVLNFRTWIKNRTFQILLACNIVILTLTITFIFVLSRSWINALIVISGWTSLGALALGDYLGIKAIKAEKEFGEFFNQTDIKAAILHLDRFITDFEQFTSTPEGAEFIRKLVKGVEIMEKLTG